MKENCKKTTVKRCQRECQSQWLKLMVDSQVIGSTTKVDGSVIKFNCWPVEKIQ